MKGPAHVHTAFLQPCPHGLRAVEAQLGDRRALFLVDTGAGVTSVDRALASRLGLEPRGRLTGHRMTGERVDMQCCADLVLEIAGFPIQHETVGVVDLAGFLPPGFPPIEGVLALNTFEERPFTLDLAAGELHVETDESLRARTARMAELRVRTSRQPPGIALDVFVAARTSCSALWLELDSCNSGPLLLAPHAARQLGIDLSGPAVRHEPATERRTERWHVPPLDLEIEGLGPLRSEAVVQELIIDGNLGSTFTANRAFTFDLRASRLWVTP